MKFMHFTSGYFICIFYSVYSYNVTDEDRLYRDLFNNYNKELRAGNDRDYPLNVSMQFYLLAIKEFVEASSKFTINGVFYTHWRDERLSWVPAKYNNITKTLVSQDKVWIPNIVNINPFKEVYGLGSNLVQVNVDNEGSCFWVTMQSFEVVCDADVTYYPFDKQFCALRFVAYTVGVDWLNIYFPNSKVTLTSYEESGLWEVEDTTNYSHTEEGTTFVVVGLHLKRRSTYYIASLLLPMTVVAILQAFVFLLPNDAGERVGFSVTVLLASVVFLTIIQGKLPEASEPNISVLGFLLFGYVILGALVTLCVILSANIHSFKEDTCMPKWLKILCCLKTIDAKGPFSTNIVMNVEPQKEAKEKECRSWSWKDVAKRFDMFCFISSLFLYVLQIIIYFGLAT
ncbi:neuronal acetylcholine receptor subunit alpha-6-like [Ostrea edulis]|uniref:neuronal acetylcholine receptor subunit alpha-6-like n=1 Tax=Ostrea edulis TaxID=37623 RepID=UPI0024AFCBA6|nr:neuronal acetylcholine receptor subunit alpha-6-like [Ostrea edulis]